MRCVKSIVQTGRTIVSTIHQPSIDIFEQFDELVLLKRGGETIYCGPLGTHSKDLVAYFEVATPDPYSTLLGILVKHAVAYVGLLGLMASLALLVCVHACLHDHGLTDAERRPATACIDMPLSGCWAAQDAAVSLRLRPEPHHANWTRTADGGSQASVKAASISWIGPFCMTRLWPD